jgi:hypothetical protein
MDSQIAEPDSAARIASIPIEEIDVARPSLFQNDTIGLFFDRLRADTGVANLRSRSSISLSLASVLVINDSTRMFLARPR